MSVVQMVQNLRTKSELKFEKLLKLKESGRPLPDLTIKQTSKDKNKEVHRNFSRSMYDLSDWICGCEESDAFYCFVCLLFSNNSLWCKNGVQDLKHLKEKIKKHSLSADHMRCAVSFATIGTEDIRSQLDNTYKQSVRLFNENVSKNRYIISKIINCVKFCGAFELALQGQDEAESSVSPGIFRGLINFVSELDPIFKEYLDKATVFDCTSKTVQNELLDSMLSVAQEQLKLDIQTAEYIAVQVDETTDSSNRTQMTFIIRYILSGVLHERFFKFLNPSGTTTEHLSEVIFNELEVLEINKTPEKLIGQSYDGASTMSGRLGRVQKKIKERYPHANFIHCYAHELNLILQKAASQNKNVKVFFSNLQRFSTFFGRSPKRTAILDKFVKVRLPRAAPIMWNFNTGSVETVFLYQADILASIEKIIEVEEDSNTINQAIGLKNVLQTEDFLYWLNFFHLIMPNCEDLFNQLQKRSIDVVLVKKNIDSFKMSIQKVRDHIISNEIFPEAPSSSSTLCAKRLRKNEDSNKLQIASEICDIIISEINHRFSFNDHLVIAQLFYSDQFEQYKINFPDHILKSVRENFPSINYLKLRTELQVIYERDDFNKSSGAVPMLQLFINNKISETFSETVKLLTILCTLPMTTVESERCFSTLKRIKTFLRNTMEQERLSALAMLSIEKQFINSIDNFNERVIVHFANTEDRRLHLNFKRI